MLFRSKASTHLFLHHLQSNTMLDPVWESLYTVTGAKEYHCKLCPKIVSNEVWIKHHSYNEHKKDLKKKFDENCISWKDLLDHIGYDVPNDEVDAFIDALRDQCVEETSSAELEHDNGDKVIENGSPSASLEEGEIPDEEDDVEEIPAEQAPNKYVCSFKNCGMKFQLKTAYFNHY